MKFILLPVYLFFIWKNIGFHLIAHLVNSLRLPVEYYEAAQIDGATYIKYQIFIVAPLSIPVFFFSIIMSIVQSFRVFKEVFLIHGPYPDDKLYMVQNYINNKFVKLNYSELSTGSVIFVFITLLALFAIFWFGRLIFRRVYD